MKQQSVFVPVPVEERLPDVDCTVDVMYEDEVGIDTCVFTVVYSKEKGFFDPNGNYNCTGITHWLEKKEEVFVMTKEELRDFAEQARRYTLNNAQHVGSAVYVMGSTDDFLDDFLNQQTTLK